MLRSRAFENIQEIFVGRGAELTNLGDLWNGILKPKEHFAYTLLNAPGTGKTTLLNYFGENFVVGEKKAIFVSVRCKSSYGDRMSFVDSVRKSLAYATEIESEALGVTLPWDRLSTIIDDIAHKVPIFLMFAGSFMSRIVTPILSPR